jgi:hypothetical protein
LCSPKGGVAIIRKEKEKKRARWWGELKTSSPSSTSLELTQTYAKQPTKFSKLRSFT